MLAIITTVRAYDIGIARMTLRQRVKSAAESKLNKVHFTAHQEPLRSPDESNTEIYPAVFRTAEFHHRWRVECGCLSGSGHRKHHFSEHYRCCGDRRGGFRHRLEKRPKFFQRSVQQQHQETFRRRLIDVIEVPRTIYLPDAGPFRGEAVRGMPKAKLIRSSSHGICGCLVIGARASMQIRLISASANQRRFCENAMPVKPSV
jgi:hypothetical protein